MASRTAKAAAKRGKMQEYNAQGSKAVEAADDEQDDFKKGGHAKKHGKKHHELKHGGHAEGHKAKMRADKKERGEPKMHKRAGGGRTPYSSGHNTSTPSISGKTDSGHQGQRPPVG